MVQESSLLAHLVPRLTNRGEDTATDALAFILNKSGACRRALDLLLADSNFNLQPIANFQTQVTYKDGSRPDMVGYDRDGGKRLLSSRSSGPLCNKVRAPAMSANSKSSAPAYSCLSPRRPGLKHCGPRSAASLKRGTARCGWSLLRPLSNCAEPRSATRKSD